MENAMKKYLLIFISALGLILSSNFAAAKSIQYCSMQETFYISPDRESSASLQNKNGLGTFAFTVSKTQGGDKIGTAIIRRTSLGLNDATPGPNPIYELSSTIVLSQGNIIVYGFIDTDVEKTDAKIERAIVGGTGLYSGINGSFFTEHLGKMVYKLTAKAAKPCM